MIVNNRFEYKIGIINDLQCNCNLLTVITISFLKSFATSAHSAFKTFSLDKSVNNCLLSLFQIVF